MLSNLFLFASVAAASAVNMTMINKRADAGILVKDTGTASACGGKSSCCEPSCTVSVTEVNGCESGDLAWSGTCMENYDLATGTQDVDNYSNCDGYSMSWSKRGDGVLVTITKKSDGSFDDFVITNCQTASTGGTQCAPSDGGCDAALTF